MSLKVSIYDRDSIILWCRSVEYSKANQLWKVLNKLILLTKPFIGNWAIYSRSEKSHWKKKQSNDINVQKIKYVQKILSLNAHTFQEMLWQKSVFNKNLANTSKKKVHKDL